MSRDPTLVQTEDIDALQRYAVSYLLVRVTCTCGHYRDMHHKMIQRFAERRYTIGALRIRLRCAQCGKKQPALQVFKLPR